VSVVMVECAPRPFIGARGGRGGGQLEGARPVPLMVVGGHFGRGTGEPWVGFKGGGRRRPFLGEERTAERRQRAYKLVAMASWPSSQRRKMKGVGPAHP
jgi:hypothetical protein